MTLGQPFSVVSTRAFGKIIVHIHGGVGVDKAQELHDRLLDVMTDKATATSSSISEL